MRQRPLLGYKKLKIVGNDQLLPIYEKPNKLITSFEQKWCIKNRMKNNI